jgi:hypothetical protein
MGFGVRMLNASAVQGSLFNMRYFSVIKKSVPCASLRAPCPTPYAWSALRAASRIRAVSGR